MTSNDIIQFLREHKSTLHGMGVRRIGLFGSYAKGTQRPDSDIDILVDLDEPTFSKLMSVLLFLETSFGRPVDLIRKGSHIRPSFIKSIESDLIYA